jgi:hypothetical protein
MLLVCGIAAGAFVLSGAWSRSEPYAPAQPLDFSHRDHIQEDGLDCELCHSGVRRSAFAGIAPLERCMGCHRFVLPFNPDITELRRYWEARKAIPWVKVYALPRFVRFSHEAHTTARVGCATCHGNVALMDRIAQVTPLTMGWCVGCHRNSRAPVDCLTCHY